MIYWPVYKFFLTLICPSSPIFHCSLLHYVVNYLLFILYVFLIFLELISKKYEMAHRSTDPNAMKMLDYFMKKKTDHYNNSINTCVCVHAQCHEIFPEKMVFPLQTMLKECYLKMTDTLLHKPPTDVERLLSHWTVYYVGFCPLISGPQFQKILICF